MILNLLAVENVGKSARGCKLMHLQHEHAKHGNKKEKKCLESTFIEPRVVPDDFPFFDSRQVISSSSRR